jgi:putative aminopeptidase FrvX
LGSGVLIGAEQTTGTPLGLGADIKKLSDANRISIATDYSVGVIPPSDLQQSPFPSKWLHLGIATAWANTPAEAVDVGDLQKLEQLLEAYAQGVIAPAPESNENAVSQSPPAQPETAGSGEILKQLIAQYGVSHHEEAVREQIKRLLPPWAKPETDAAGNLIVIAGAAPPGSKVDRILLMAHMDETGFEIKSVSKDGRLEVEAEGYGENDDFEGHPALVHSQGMDHDAIIELPNHWDEANFHWPQDSESAIRVDVGARTPEDVAGLGIKPGDSVTVAKLYRPLSGTRATARSFDDRVGCTALLTALRTLDGPIANRDVTFVWTTQEEIGLRGAAALAKRLASEGREPAYVFAVDTFVSSDSPLESKRFADAELGKGFVVRALDDSNTVPRELVEKIVRLARANRIPVQFGVTGGANDGSQFLPYGAVDIPIGWPLRYSHSPGEVIDTRDVDSLARILGAIAQSW